VTWSWMAAWAGVGGGTSAARGTVLSGVVRLVFFSAFFRVNVDFFSAGPLPGCLMTETTWADFFSGDGVALGVLSDESVAVGLFAVDRGGVVPVVVPIGRRPMVGDDLAFVIEPLLRVMATPPPPCR